MPAALIRQFQRQYGEKKGEQVYYATAAKQGRDPETFQKRETAKKVTSPFPMRAK